MIGRPVADPRTGRPGRGSRRSCVLWISKLPSSTTFALIFEAEGAYAMTMDATRSDHGSRRSSRRTTPRRRRCCSAGCRPGSCDRAAGAVPYARRPRRADVADATARLRHPQPRSWCRRATARSSCIARARARARSTSGACTPSRSRQAVGLTAEQLASTASGAGGRRPVLVRAATRSSSASPTSCTTPTPSLTSSGRSWRSATATSSSWSSSSPPAGTARCLRHQRRAHPAGALGGALRDRSAHKGRYESCRASRARFTDAPMIRRP